MKKIIRLAFCFLLLPFTAMGQDSTLIFNQDQLIWYIKKYHPVSIQADLLLQQGESAVTQARGGFDPYLFMNLDQKYYDEKTYYSILGTGLKVPTWYGIELKTGYDQNRGAYLNPENNLPADGLWYAGISVPVGQGLFIDKRRATLQQAKLFAESTLAEQQKIMNYLYFDAIKQYWKWVEAWNQYLVYEESVQLAVTRFNAVKQSFLLGDVPAIDTLEAFIQVQNRQMNRNQTLLMYQNSTLELSNYLWYENNTPLIITDSIRPPSTSKITLPDVIYRDSLDQLLLQVESLHPEMQLYQYKLASMEVERRLKVEGLKPKINLNYNTINEPTGTDFLSGISPENYKWGVDFSIPIFLREQRGDLQLTKIKIQDTELTRQQALLALQNDVRSYYNEQVNLEQQVLLYRNAVQNYDRLLQGERVKFDTGESSLFLVNARETNLIDAQLKLIELIAKYNIASTGLIWASGQLFDM